MKPYTYHIGWKDLDIHYYGVRYAQDCDPSDLWNPYKTSSDYVEAFIIENGEPDIIEVDRIFETTAAACEWEHRVLTKLKVAKNPRWLNKTDNKSIPPLYGEEHPHFGKTGPEHHSYGLERLDVAERQKQLWKMGEHPIMNAEAQAQSLAKRSGDNHHMKRVEVVTKVSGSNHYSAQPGYVTPKSICQYCSNSYSSGNIKKHEKACKRDLTNLVVARTETC